MSSLYHFLWRLQLTTLRCLCTHMQQHTLCKRYGPHGLLTKGVLLIEDGGSIERWYGYVRCDNFIGKVRFVRAGGGFLLAKTPRHN